MMPSQLEMKEEANMSELPEAIQAPASLEGRLITEMRDFMQSRPEPHPIFRFQIG